MDLRIPGMWSKSGEVEKLELYGFRVFLGPGRFTRKIVEKWCSEEFIFSAVNRGRDY